MKSELLQKLEVLDGENKMIDGMKKIYI